MGNRDKTRAFLTEFIIVILFFSISAIICVQLFVAASKESRDSRELTEAVIQSENLAEKLLAISDIDSYEKDDYYTTYFDSNWEIVEDINSSRYILSVSKLIKDYDSGSLLTAVISVDDGDELIYRINISKYFAEQ